VRGKRGIVTALHGSIINPLDHRGMYPPLCSVVFPVREVSGGASQDTLSVDVHEDWLAPLGPPCCRWDRRADDLFRRSDVRSRSAPYRVHC
jgi:hypothetical protein